MRATIALEAKKAKAERERQVKIARGILKPEDELKSTRRSHTVQGVVREGADIDIYAVPERLPIGRPHNCLFMTMYPGKRDMKPGMAG